MFNPRIALLFLRTRVALGVEKQQMRSFPTIPWGFRPWRVQRKWLRQRPTTGNSNITAQTGNTYISGTIIDSVEITTAIHGRPCQVYRKCPKWLHQRPIIRNSNMAAQTGNTYISGTMTDSVEIPTAILGFSTMPNLYSICHSSHV